MYRVTSGHERDTQRVPWRHRRATGAVHGITRGRKGLHLRTSHAASLARGRKGVRLVRIVRPRTEEADGWYVETECTSAAAAAAATHLARGAPACPANGWGTRGGLLVPGVRWWCAYDGTLDKVLCGHERRLNSF